MINSLPIISRINRIDCFDPGKLISNSAKFAEENNPLLTRTQTSSDDSKKWIVSAWVKKASLTPGEFMGAGASGYNILGETINLGNRLTLHAVRHDVTEIYAVRSETFVRDVAGPYHVFIKFDSTQVIASDRVKMWIGGKLVPISASSTFPPLNYTDSRFNFGSTNFWVGAGPNASVTGALVYGSEYISEFHFLDNIDTDPDSFGYFNIDGVWVAKDYAGGHGSNGVYLPFTNGADLGEDNSGNNNDFTNSNVTQSDDTPTNTHCSLNELSLRHNANVTLSEAGNKIAQLTPRGVLGTISVASGKWYWEVECLDSTPNNNAFVVGIASPAIGNNFNVDGLWYTTLGGWGYWANTGDSFHNNINSPYGASYTNGDIIGVALDLEAGTLEFYKNNVSQGIAYSGLNNGDSYTPVIEDSVSAVTNTRAKFTLSDMVYSPPAGFTPLSRPNIPCPEVTNGRLYFQPVLDTGANILAAAQATGLTDLIWIKDRDNAVSHQLIDSSRGGTLVLESDTSDIERAYSAPAGNSVAWCFKKKIGFFGIEIDTGDGISGNIVGHSLGVSPELILRKQRTSPVGDWSVFHKDIGADKYLRLNTTALPTISTLVWNDTLPDASNFTLGSGALSNAVGEDFVTYLFASLEGLSKVGKYIGNGNADGAFIYTGFKPAFFLFKRVSDITSAWHVKDNIRDGVNPIEPNIVINTAASEQASNDDVDFVSNGIKIRNTSGSVNASGAEYIYLAISENAFKLANAR